MMKDKKKVIQPYRNPSEYACFREGVRRVAEIFGYGISHASFSGGLPTEIKLFKIAGLTEPEPVVAVEILEHTAETSRRVGVVPEAGEQLRVVKDDAEPDAGT